MSTHILYTSILSHVSSRCDFCYSYLRHAGRFHRCLSACLFVCLLACLFVSNFAQKLPNGFTWNFQGRLAMDRLNFGGDPGHHLDTGIVFRIRYIYEIGKAGLCYNYYVITSLALGGGMHSPSASSWTRRPASADRTACRHSGYWPTSDANAG